MIETTVCDVLLIWKGQSPSLSTCDPLSEDPEHWTTFSIFSGHPQEMIKQALATLMTPKTSPRPFSHLPAPKRGLGLRHKAAHHTFQPLW